MRTSFPRQVIFFYETLKTSFKSKILILVSIVIKKTSKKIKKSWHLKNKLGSGFAFSILYEQKAVSIKHMLCLSVKIQWTQ
jgi:hypothetical protein